MLQNKIAPDYVTEVLHLCRVLAWHCVIGIVPMGFIPVVQAQGDLQSASSSGQYVVDATGALTATAALARPDWRPLPAVERWPAAPAVVWFRFQVRAGFNDGAGVVVVPRVFLQEATVLTHAPGSDTWQAVSAGDRFHFSAWPMPGPVVALPFTAPPSPPGSTEVLVRLRHGSAFRDVPSLWSASAWQARLAIEHMVMGIFIGVALVSMLYAAVEAIARHDAVSGWYGLHVFLMTLVVIGQLGYLRVYPGVDDAVVHRGYLFGAGTLLAVATLLFVQRALPQAFGGKLASRLSLATAVTGVMLGALYTLWPQVAEDAQVWSARVYFYGATVACVIGLLWAARGVRMPLRWWHRAAFGAAGTGVAIYALHSSGLITGSMTLRSVLPLASAIEFSLLTYALSLSSRLVADAAPGIARDRVMDRSSGFLHVSELPALLVAMALRAMRVKQAGSVVLLHLSNLADLEAEFGAQIGPSAEQAAIRTLRLALRPGDEVVRVDRTHYVALLHRVHGQEEARDFAMRVQTLGLQYCPELPPLQQIQWHAAVGHMPQHIQRNPEKLPQRLMQLVGQIRHGSAALVRELP